MEPAFHDSRLIDIIKLKNPSKIFVGSSGDMWGEWVPETWIQVVLDLVNANPEHTFQFLTKNPRRYADFELPINAIYGTTMDGTDKTMHNFYELLNSEMYRDLFISFEPLKARIPLHLIADDFECINWIIIGADSTKGAKKPPLHWAGGLISLARDNKIPIFVKDNYAYPERFKEMP